MNADDLAKILDELGQRLGPTGERVFALAVRQVVIDGIAYAIVAAVSVVLIVLMVRWISRYVAADKAKAQKDIYYTPIYEIAYAIGGIGFLILAATAAWCTTEAMSFLLNPEYAAIRELIGAIR